MESPQPVIELFIESTEFSFEHNEEGHQEAIDAVVRELRKDYPEVESEEAILGLGADFPALYLVLAGIPLLGKQVNEALDGWIELSKKFMKTYGWLEDRFGRCQIGDKAADLLAIAHVVKQESEIESLEVIASTRDQLAGFLGESKYPLRKHPYAFYFRVFRVNGNVLYLIGIRSNGKVDFVHRQVIEGNWMEY